MNLVIDPKQLLYWALVFAGLVVVPVRAQFGYQKLDDDPYSEYKRINFWTHPHYNRVEGVTMHGGMLLKLISAKSLGVICEAKYGSKSETFRYEAGLDKRFFKKNRLILRAMIFDETATNDNWKVGVNENTLAGVFLHEDFRDYFERKGWRVFADKKFHGYHLFRFEYAQYDYGSMSTRTNFAGSIFGGNKVYRPNPSVTEGREKSLKLSLAVDHRDNLYFPDHGWVLHAVLQKTMGDFNTNGFFLDWTHYTPTWAHQKFVLRGLFGMRSGTMGAQHLMSIGGVGTLRAFRDYFRSGQNFSMLNAIYLFGGDILQNSPLRNFPLMDSTFLGFFCEIGDAWNNENSQDFVLNINQARWLSDAGVSLLLMDGLLRLDFARQIKGGSSDWRITCRLFNKL